MKNNYDLNKINEHYKYCEDFYYTFIIKYMKWKIKQKNTIVRTRNRSNIKYDLSNKLKYFDLYQDNRLEKNFSEYFIEYLELYDKKSDKLYKHMKKYNILYIMYSKIYNPDNNKFINTNLKLGYMILLKYLNQSGAACMACGSKNSFKKHLY